MHRFSCHLHFVSHDVIERFWAWILIAVCMSQTSLLEWALSNAISANRKLAWCRWMQLTVACLIAFFSGEWSFTYSKHNRTKHIEKSMEKSMDCYACLKHYHILGVSGCAIIESKLNGIQFRVGYRWSLAVCHKDSAVDSLKNSHQVLWLWLNALISSDYHILFYLIFDYLQKFRHCNLSYVLQFHVQNFSIRWLISQNPWI